ncbi:hypothetical protein BJQ89_03054 [Arthrobacter sp. ES1]|nr:hypothetical protein [Arthrobacter sp. ES1]
MLGQQPAQGDVHGCPAQALRRHCNSLHHAGCRTFKVRLDISCQPLLGGPRIRGNLAAVLPAQHPPSHRAPSHQAQSGVLDGRYKFGFGGAAQEGVFGLVGDQRETSHRCRLCRLPAVEVRDACIAGTARAHREFKCGQGLLQRDVRIPGLSEPEVHVVGPQPRKARIQAGKHSVPRGVHAAPAIRRRQPGFCGNDYLRARHDVAQHAAQHRLGPAFAVGRCSVQQGPASVQKSAEQGRGILLICFPGPGHGAEGKGGHAQPTVADITLLHVSKLTGIRTAS